ncbi:MAG: DivIVA domain-containing protein [Acidobacteriota bacterium]|nr:DivIVA domain-containing protein [Acidobacteriota bacterium]
MESKTNVPSFTVSLRGYDRMEVDEYLDSLAEALGQVEEAEDRNRAMQAHIERLNTRIADLEERISKDVPRTGAVLGERIAILLRGAEETAADTIGRAEATAAGMIEKAREEVASAEDQARGAIARGEEQARRIEAAARAEAAEIVAEAEARATARTRQIEQWAEQVISHTRAEEARMLAEQKEKRERGEAELRALADQRDAVAATIAGLRESLGQALGLVGPVGRDQAAGHEAPGGAADPAAGTGPTTGDPAAEVVGAAEETEVSTSDGEVVVTSDGEGVAAGDHDEPARGAGATEVTEVTEPTDERHAPTVDGEAHQGHEPHMTEAESVAPTAEVATGSDLSPTAPPVASEPLGPNASPAGGSRPHGVASSVASAPNPGAVDQEMPWPTAFSPIAPIYRTDDTTGEIAVVSGRGGVESKDFSSKIDAWVSGNGGLGPRHFRRN